MHRMSRLMHLRTYRVTAKAKKFLLRRNPDINIHEGSPLRNLIIPLANLELHEIPQINIQDLLIGLRFELGGGDENVGFNPEDDDDNFGDEDESEDYF